MVRERRTRAQGTTSLISNRFLSVWACKFLRYTLAYTACEDAKTSPVAHHRFISLFSADPTWENAELKHSPG